MQYPILLIILYIVSAAWALYLFTLIWSSRSISPSIPLGFTYLCKYKGSDQGKYNIPSFVVGKAAPSSDRGKMARRIGGVYSATVSYMKPPSASSTQRVSVIFASWPHSKKSKTKELNISFSQTLTSKSFRKLSYSFLVSMILQVSSL